MVPYVLIILSHIVMISKYVGKVASLGESEENRDESLSSALPPILRHRSSLSQSIGYECYDISVLR